MSRPKLNRDREGAFDRAFSHALALCNTKNIILGCCSFA